MTVRRLTLVPSAKQPRSMTVAPERRAPSGPRELAAKPTRALEVVARVLAHVRAAPGERWTIGRMARLVAVSRAVLGRLFHHVLATSPMRAVARIRLEHAADLLVSTDAPLGVVAAAVGYASEFAFNRAFKRLHGVPPGRHRSAGRGGFRMAA